LARKIRFIHTSDIHLDTSFAGSRFPSRLGDRKREAIRSTFRRIIEDAKREAVDFVLIAGDLFEHDRITPDTVQFLKQQFESLGGIRVFISPGNHDPYLRGSPYHDEAWPANVHIFRNEEFRVVELPDLGARVVGFGFNRTQLEEHHFARLDRLADDAVNIVVSHGSDLGRVPEGKAKHGPLTIEEVAGKNIQYCALGHYHQQRPVANPIDDTVVWYAGIPEGRGWDETGSRAYLFCEIENGQARVQGIECNQYPLQVLTIECEGFSTREQIIAAVLQQRGVIFNDRTILRIRLTGSLDPRLDLSTSEMEERLAGEVLHLQWEDQTQPALDFQVLAEEKTLCGWFVRALNERIANSAAEERETLERARQYGVQALLGREIRPR
jgi:DNA repair exonuclease SbcCD nuclease subunit